MSDTSFAVGSLVNYFKSFAPNGYMVNGGTTALGQTLAPLVAELSQFIEYKDDFARGSAQVATTLQPVGYKYAGDGNGNVVSIDGAGGLLQISTTATAQDESYLSVDGLTSDANDFFNITANSGKKLWYETRLKASQSGNNFSLFAGLFTSSAVAANALVDTTGAIVDTNFVGFQIDPALGTSWIYTHKKSGQTVQKQTAIATNDGATYMKFTIAFDGGTGLTFYVNDVKVGLPVDVSAATFPSGSGLVPAVLLKSTSAAAKAAVVDYVHVIQGR
jgi:hypothetical protein